MSLRTSNFVELFEILADVARRAAADNTKLRNEWIFRFSVTSRTTTAACTRYCHKITHVIAFRNFSLAARHFRDGRAGFRETATHWVRFRGLSRLLKAFPSAQAAARCEYACSREPHVVRFPLAKLIFPLEFFRRNFAAFHARKVAPFIEIFERGMPANWSDDIYFRDDVFN